MAANGLRPPAQTHGPPADWADRLWRIVGRPFQNLDIGRPIGRQDQLERGKPSSLPSSLASGLGLVVIGALLFGVIAQFVGENAHGFEWLVDSVTASAIVPALLGGLIVGLVVEVTSNPPRHRRDLHRPSDVSLKLASRP